jgi:hypothetical protein
MVGTYFSNVSWQSKFGAFNLGTERGVPTDITDAYGVVEWILKQRELKRELIVITLWFIWSERNCIREEGRRRPAEVIA